MHTLTREERLRHISARNFQYRRANKLTQKQMARLLGITRDKYANIENCRSETAEWLISKMQSVGVSIYPIKKPCVTLTQQDVSPTA